MSAPVYRRPVFLLGLFPLVILVTGWAQTVHSSVHWGRTFGKDKVLSLALHDSSVAYRFVQAQPADGGKFERGKGPFPTTPFLGSVELTPPVPARWYVPPEWRQSRAKQFGTVEQSSLLILPFWLILAGYVLVWLGLSFLLQRTLADKAATPPQASPVP